MRKGLNVFIKFSDLSENVEIKKVKLKYRSSGEPVLSKKQDEILKEKINLVISVNLYQAPYTVMLNVNSEEMIFYNKNVSLSLDAAIQLCFDTRHQNNQLWKEQRTLRITICNAYSYVTYTKNKKTNWDEKIKKSLESSFQGSEDTRHGLLMEEKALQVYKNSTNNEVVRMGL